MIELLVVIVILAILGTIAIPNFMASLRHEQLTATSREVVDWLEEARNESLKEMTSCELLLTLDSSQDMRLEVKTTSPGCSQKQPLIIGAKNPDKMQVSVSGQEQVTTEILFSPRGTTSRTHEWILTTQKSSVSHCIRISSPLGLIRLGRLRANQCDYSQAL